MSGLNDYLSRLPISRKLILVMVSVVLAVALIASTTLILSAYLVSRNNFVPASVQAVTRILSEEPVLNTLLKSPEKATEVLDAASEYSLINSIALYDSNGRLYATHDLKGQPHNIPNTAPEQIENETQHIARVDLADGGTVTFYIETDPSLPMDFYAGMTIAVLIILVFIFLLTSAAARLVRRYITQPVLHLIRIANTVSIEENYGVRAQKFYHDEIGILAQAFNTMLSRIEARDQLLTSARDKAEQASMKAQALAIETHMTNKKLELEVKVRKRAEHKLTSFQNYLNNIIDSMPSALIAVDEQLLVAQCNKAATQLADMDHDAALGLPLGTFMPFLANCLPKVQQALDLQTSQLVEKLPLMLADGENYLDLVIYPLSGDDNDGAVIRIDNITRRLQLEEMMVQTEKMMSVGGLAAGMAHEINNPLGAIIQGVQNIRRRISPTLPANQKEADPLGLPLEMLNAYLENREITRFLDNINSAGMRASKIVSNMLQFSRRGSKTLTPTNLSDLIERTVEIASSDFDLKKGFDFMSISLEQDLDERLTAVPCITDEIQQVLLNLLKNAAQAINARTEANWQGKIAIRTRKQGDHALITVSDNGAGMDEDTRKRIFEPFFTTKDIGAGTGLGLSVSYFIITNNHKGAMSVISTPGIGTEFTITLNLQQSRLSEKPHMSTIIEAALP
ncbi:sensor histidine kinase [Kistimonas asteriae]|uniref:sensor histidine kinase n=1 Tax=Kistimonas asteriae TaxID=517724 RepID=UPI001BA4D743|nr:sensor histidine kinase [Kistimonas asteriae]